MFKAVFEFLTEPLGLPIEWYWEYFILAVIGVIAYAFSYCCVGNMYGDGMICGRTSGSVLHWTIRLLLFAVLWAVAYGVISTVKWLTENWLIVLCVLGGIIALVGIIAVIIILCKRKNNL